MFGSSFARLAMLHLKYTPADDSEMHGAEPERAGAARSAPADDTGMHGAEPARSGTARSARSGRHALLAGTAVLAVLALRWSKDAPVSPVALNAVTAVVAGMALLWSWRDT
jgi:hypothetical protein